MDTWKKYRDKEFKKNLMRINISAAICYGNYLISEISWLASEGKLKQRKIDKFFEQASLVIQATVAQKGLSKKDMTEMYTYIDKIAKDVTTNEITNAELGLMLGNLTELEDDYTFVELIGFVRVLASKI